MPNLGALFVKSEELSLGITGSDASELAESPIEFVAFATKV
jgi:hypothetical protein